MPSDVLIRFIVVVSLGMDELDEFNEAPHSLRSEASSFHELSHDDMERIDLDDDDDDDQTQIINILDRTVPGQISSTDLLTDDTTTIIPADNLMFDESTPSMFNSNGNLHKQRASGGGGAHTILDSSSSSSNSSNFSKSDKLTNSANGAIGDVLILTNKSKQNYGNNSHNA